MVNLATLRGRLEQYLLTSAASGAAGFDQWDATVKLDALNEAQNDVQMELLESYSPRYFAEIGGLDATNGEMNLNALPRPYLRVIAMQKQTDPLRPLTAPSNGGAGWYGEPYIKIVTVAEAWGQFQTGYELWFAVGPKLKCRDDGVNGRYRLLYHYRLKRLDEDGDETEIPDEYQDLLIYRAAYLCSLQAKEREDSARFLGEYQQRLLRMRQTASKRIMAERMRIQDVEGMSDGPYFPAGTVFFP